LPFVFNFPGGASHQERLLLKRCVDGHDPLAAL